MKIFLLQRTQEYFEQEGAAPPTAPELSQFPELSQSEPLPSPMVTAGRRWGTRLLPAS